MQLSEVISRSVGSKSVLDQGPTLDPAERWRSLQYARNIPNQMGMGYPTLHPSPKYFSISQKSCKVKVNTGHWWVNCQMLYSEKWINFNMACTCYLSKYKMLPTLTNISIIKHFVHLRLFKSSQILHVT